MKTLTIDKVKKMVGGTWFTFVMEGDNIVMETRRHRSVYDETCGKEDIAEARRILSKLPPATHHKQSMECVDEWVVVTIASAPFSAYQIKENERRLAISKQFANMKAEISNIHSPSNTASPYDLTLDSALRHWILSVSFGTATNPRHLQYKHETAEQAMQDGKPIADKWADKVTVETRSEPDHITFSGITTHRNLGVVVFIGAFSEDL